MYDQMRSLGASCDWTREKFTLDPKITVTVLETFVKMFKQKLIFRTDRMINWCPRCQTALSDLETEYKEENSKLWFIRYVFKNENRFITVATTRPETMLGDTAIAVNPKDPRYKEFIGKTVVIPLVFREIPIVADPIVDPAFGTGAVKVTPAHDPVDFEIGQKNNLEQIQVIGFDNRMTKKAGKYAGMTLKETREQIITELEAKGQLEKSEDYPHQVGRCERCGCILEPQISRQWFVKTKTLAKSAIKAVKSKKTRILPSHFEKIYFQWMDNIRDWCISRQLWWGQQIPVYYCGTEHLSPLQKLQNPQLGGKDVAGCGEIIASIEKPKKCPKCGSKELVQDPDTLDTWFSSGQWPYTTLGFPQGKDYKTFYPTTVMETGYEILFFWVARMMMMGLYRTKKVPFKTVYLHGLVRDAFGKKMSKSKGNSINPLEVTAKYGTDSLRMALVFGSTPGKDLSLSDEKIMAMRNFANKVWNASRFVLEQNAIRDTQYVIRKTQAPSSSSHVSHITYHDASHPDDKWIVEELNKTIKSVTEDIEKFKLGQAAESLYEFFWHVYCDKYIEMTKNRRTEAQETLLHVLSQSLTLLHPFMPFLTEEIWQRGKKIAPKHFSSDLLISHQWPSASKKPKKD
jgi:valyl-tRNA synthetase